MRGTFAVIGDPVAGSLSPAMHRAAFAAVGLPHDYVAVRVLRADLADVFPSLVDRLLGMNVTAPLKESVLPLLDAVDPEAAACGSVNTIVLDGGRTLGYSTDGPGFLAALEASGGPPPERAVVVGTGGAARAVAAALRRAGATVTIAGRDSQAAVRVAAALGVEAADDPAAAVARADAVTNATPAAAPGDSPLLDELPLHPGLTVIDLVSRPRRTALLARAEAAGCRTVEGVDVLVAQGARSFEMWTGAPAPVEAMRRAALAALAQPSEVPG